MELFAASYLLPVSSPPIAGGAVAIADGRIVDVGALSDLRKLYSAPIREFPGCVIMPGLVNAHSHLELTHFPSWKIRKGIDYAPRTYVDWIIQVIKVRRSLSPQELELSVKEGIRICLEAGTTTIGEILSDRSLLHIYCASPLVGRIYFEAIGHDQVHCSKLLSHLENSVANFNCGSLAPGISPHAPHTLSPSFHQDIVRLASAQSVPRMIHLAESPEESDFFFDSSGNITELLYPHIHWEQFIPPPGHITPTAFMDGIGAIDAHTTAVHCVHVSQADIDILKHRGACVVLCPRSNEKLDVGKAPVHLLKKKGIPLALGTDSLASNDSLSMWDEMRFLLDAFPGDFSPSEVLFMATSGAARALSLCEEVGSIEKGKRGDILVMDPHQSAIEEDLYTALIHGGELLDVFVAGRQLTF